jgi:hypothetical protein
VADQARITHPPEHRMRGGVLRGPRQDLVHFVGPLVPDDLSGEARQATRARRTARRGPAAPDSARGAWGRLPVPSCSQRGGPVVWREAQRTGEPRRGDQAADPQARGVLAEGDYKERTALSTLRVTALSPVGTRAHDRVADMTTAV